MPHFEANFQLPFVVGKATSRLAILISVVATTDIILYISSVTNVYAGWVLNGTRNVTSDSSYGGTLFKTTGEFPKR